MYDLFIQRNTKIEATIRYIVFYIDEFGEYTYPC